MAAVIALTARHVRSHHHSITDFQRNAFEIEILSAAANRGDCPHIFVTLDNGKSNLLPIAAARILGDVTLVGVLVGAADPREFHLDDHAARSRFGERILSYFVLSRLDERSG